MYITISSIKKTLGKYIELNDLFIGIPMLIIFLSLFSFSSTRMFSIVFLTICIFSMIPVNVSKKNRMYKVLWLFISYVVRCKRYIWRNNLK